MIIRNYSIVAFVYLSTLLQLSCGNNKTHVTKKTDLESKEFKDKLVEANKIYVKRESDEIDQYVKHKKWGMTTTGSGLRYMITKKGLGLSPQTEQHVKLNFKISLLDGTLCYSSDSTGSYEFVVDKSSVETGLHEGVKYMHVGDQALLILPSHLAYGLIGDENKIPPRASVVYELELLSVR
jgi:FKBP-type peptidyl-prolyl cis-trans isomerase FkpA